MGKETRTIKRELDGGETEETLRVIRDGPHLKIHNKKRECFDLAIELLQGIGSVTPPKGYDPG